MGGGPEQKGLEKVMAFPTSGRAPTCPPRPSTDGLALRLFKTCLTINPLVD